MAAQWAASLVARAPQAESTNIATGDAQADILLNLLANGFQGTIGNAALVASVASSLGITAIIVIAFCFVRPYNNVVYAPRAKYADSKHQPPPVPRHPLGWIGPVFRTKEPELVEKLGLDAAVFLRFTRMCRNMFIVLAIVGCSVLMPINVVGSKDFFALDKTTLLERLTPQYLILSPYFWAYVVMAYVFNIIICGFLWWNYRAVVALRRKHFESPEYQNSLAARTLLISSIPPALRSNEGIQQITEETYRTLDVPRAAIARKVKDLPDLIADHTETVERLEKVLAKYLKNPDKLPLNRPVCKVSKRDENHKKGEKVDAIEYLTSRISKLEREIKEVRRNVDARDATNYGFASYTQISDAHLVAYAGRKGGANKTQIRLTPKPTDLIWKNLTLTPKDRRWRNFVNNLWVALLTLFFIVPNVFIAVFLTNLSHLGRIWPAFQDSLSGHPKWWGVVQGIAAPAITALFYFYLPAIFRRLSINAGDVSKTSRDKHVLHKLFSFFVFNQLFIQSLFSALWGFLAALIGAALKNDNAFEALKNAKVFQSLVTSLQAMSLYWLTYLLQRNLGAAIDLVQLFNLAWGSFSRRWLSPTPREQIRLSAPQPFDYPSYYNYFLFYIIVALCYAPFQPLALPITALYFWLDSHMKKYLLMYVVITKTESGGRFWKVVFNRVIFSMICGTLVTALLVGAQGSTWNMLIAIAPLPFLTLGFKFYCSRVFDTQMDYYTTTRNVERDASGVTREKQKATEKVGTRFGHPALYRPLITPMVHAKAKNVLTAIYSGRTDVDDDMHTVSGYSDMYMNPMSSARPGKAAPTSNAPFEIVNESDLDFSNFKDRQDFRGDAGGDGALYGRNPDLIRRNSEQSTISDLMYGDATRPGSRADSINSDLTKVGDGVIYPAGYHHAPIARPGTSNSNRLREQSVGGESHASDDAWNNTPVVQRPGSGDRRRPGTGNRTNSESGARLLSDAERMGRMQQQGQQRDESDRSTSRSQSRQGQYRDGSIGPAAARGRWVAETPGTDDMTSYDYFRGRGGSRS